MFDNMEDEAPKGGDKVKRAEALIDEAKGLLEEAGKDPAEYIADYVGGEEEGEEEESGEIDDGKKALAVAMLRKKAGMKGDE